MGEMRGRKRSRGEEYKRRGKEGKITLCLKYTENNEIYLNKINIPKIAIIQYT